MASRRLQIAPAEHLVSRGSRRAALHVALEARCSLHQARSADANEGRERRAARAFWGDLVDGHNLVARKGFVHCLPLPSGMPLT